MNKARFAVALALLAVVSGCASRAASRSTGHDPDIDTIVRHIDPARIKQTVDQLASFETRHTLSASDNPTRGIGAARRWIKEQFDEYAKASNGRLVVEFQEVNITKSTERVPHPPVTIVNVIATLPARTEQAKKRVYVVSGHYDSR